MRCRAVQHLGDEVLRLRDGSLRAVLECRAQVSAAHVLDVLATLRHPVQMVLRGRRAGVADENSWRRLRASQALLTSQLAGHPAFVQQVLVTVPWDVDEGGDGLAVLETRAGDVRARIDRIDADPVRLTGSELDAVALLDVAHEGRCEVHAAGRLARTLILTRLDAPLADHSLRGLDCDRDLSLLIRPASAPGHFELGAYLTVWAGSRSELDAATERAEALLAARRIRARRPYLQAEPALVSTFPVALDLIGVTRVVEARPASIAGDHALLYGADPGTRQALRLDRFALRNTNGLVLGCPADRFRVLLLELVRACLAGISVHVIDGTGAYAMVVSALDGRVIVPTGFDAFSVSPDGLEPRLRTLAALIELTASGLAPDGRAVVEDALAYVYAAHGYAHDGDNAECEPPALSEVVAALERRSAAAASAAAALERLLKQRSSPRRLGRLSVHNLTALPRHERPAAALLSLDLLWRQTADARRSLVVLDGIDDLLSGSAGHVLADLMAASLARPTGLTLATDDVPGVLHGPLRNAALTAGLKVLLRQEPPAADLLGEAFRLTPAEQTWLLRAARDEGLLVTEDRRLAFRAVASIEEDRLIRGETR